MKQADVGNFLRWGAAASVDTAERLLRLLPFSRPEELVEIPSENDLEDEALDIRCSSW